MVSYAPVGVREITHSIFSVFDRLAKKVLIKRDYRFGSSTRAKTIDPQNDSVLKQSTNTNI